MSFQSDGELTIIRRILRKKTTNTDIHQYLETRKDAVKGKDSGKLSPRSSQRVRDHALRVMRNTREQLDDDLLARAEKAIIDNALQENDSGIQYYNKSEDVPIDRRKNLKTVHRFLEKHNVSREMQHNLAKLMRDFTQH